MPPVPPMMPSSTPSAPTQKNILQIVLIVISALLAVGLGAIYVGLNSLSNDVKQLAVTTDQKISASEQLARQTLDAVQNLKKETLTTTPPTTLTETSDWKTFTFGNFTFLYPSTLTPKAGQPVVQEGWSVTQFTDANGKTAFRLTCPMPETGFEAWNFTKQNRTITKKQSQTLSKNMMTYEISLMLGTPVAGSEDLGNFNLILMKNTTDETLKDSCMLTSEADTTSSLYQRIYESIK